jgi:hypothetical protein
MCNDLLVIEDRDVVASLQRVGTRRCSPNHSHLDYEIKDVSGGDGFVELTLIERDGLQARIRLNLPSSGKLQPWLYAVPNDADDWVGQLLTWTDEEVFTLGLGESRTRVVEDGESLVIVEPYGWRLSDPLRHEQLSSSAGPLGWHGDVYAEDQEG